MCTLLVMVVCKKITHHKLHLDVFFVVKLYHLDTLSCFFFQYIWFNTFNLVYYLILMMISHYHIQYIYTIWRKCLFSLLAPYVYRPISKRCLHSVIVCWDFQSTLSAFFDVWSSVNLKSWFLYVEPHICVNKTQLVNSCDSPCRVKWE